MLGWGFVFVAVGLLSFVLPLFGRQFVLVTALGLSGMGSFAAGVAFVGLGATLVSLALRRESRGTLADQAGPRPEPQPLPRRESIFSDSSDGLVIAEKALARADAGDVRVQILVGSAYLYGSNGLPQDVAAGFRYLLKAAEQGHGMAMFVVAGLYADGRGVETNLDEARRWALAAKAAGHADVEQMIAAINAKRAS